MPCFLYHIMLGPLPAPTLFPYTTLFRSRIDAPDLVHLRASHRLTIGDDGERLERRRREPARTQRELGAIDGLRVLATGEELPSLRDLHQLHPVVLSDVRVPDLGEPGVDRRFAGLRLEGVQLAHRERAGRREQRRLKQLREGTHAGSRSGRT